MESSGYTAIVTLLLLIIYAYLLTQNYCDNYYQNGSRSVTTCNGDSSNQFKLH